MQREQHSLAQLLRVYGLRHDKLKLRAAEQQRQVQASQQELEQRSATVNVMRATLDDSIATLAAESTASDIVATDRYRHWIKHDLEREEFYLQMTQRELAENQTELSRINASIRRLELKTRRLQQRRGQLRIEREVRDEGRREEAFEALRFNRTDNQVLTT